MKTPMQEMYDQLKASRKDEYGLAFAIDMLLENEESMLDKEQQVMCEFAIDYTMQAETAYDFHRAKFNNEL